MRNNVVDAVVRSLIAQHVSTLRFDFRRACDIAPGAVRVWLACGTSGMRLRYGSSTAAAHAAHLADARAAVLALSDILGNASRVVLVGYSYGCGPAAEAALELATRLYALALISPLTTETAGVAAINHFALDKLARWENPAFFAAAEDDVYSDPRYLTLLRTAGPPPRTEIISGAEHFYRNPSGVRCLVGALSGWLIDISFLPAAAASSELTEAKVQAHHGGVQGIAWALYGALLAVVAVTLWRVAPHRQIMARPLL